MIMDRAIEKQNDLCMCFIGLETAFDSVKHGSLVDALSRFRVDDKDIRIITRLCSERKADVGVGDETSGGLR